MIIEKIKKYIYYLGNRRKVRKFLILIKKYFSSYFENIEFTHKIDGIQIIINVGNEKPVTKIFIRDYKLIINCIRLPEKYQNKGFVTKFIEFLRDNSNKFGIQEILFEMVGNENLYRLLLRNGYGEVFISNPIYGKMLKKSSHNVGACDMLLKI